jgi:hypothetical protein
VALNTLTERAAAQEAEAAEQARVVEENRRSADEMRTFQKQRAELIKAVEQAKTREEKEKAQAEKKRHDEANRELRMQNMALEKVYKESRNKAILEKLETQKSLNALTIEAAQVKTALATAMAEAKAEGADRRREADIANIKGQMQKLALEIERRQELLKKAQLATKQADKVASIATPKVSKAVERAREVGAAAIPPATNSIEDAGLFNAKKEDAAALRTKARSRARESDVTDGLRELIIQTMDDIDSAKTDMDKRRVIFEDALDAASSMQEGGREIMIEALEEFAYLHFQRARKNTAGAKADYGNDIGETF